MGADNGKEKRSGIWLVGANGEEEKVQGAHGLKFYGREPRPADEPKAIFYPKVLVVPKGTFVELETGEQGLLVRFCDSETYEEAEAHEEAKLAEDLAQAQAFARDMGDRRDWEGVDKAEAEVEKIKKLKKLQEAARNVNASAS